MADEAASSWGRLHAPRDAVALPPGTDAALDRFDDRVRVAMGLHFSGSRRSDLLRAVREAARARGETDVGAFLFRLAEAPLSQATIEMLAPYLTVGETYFFRETKSLDAFREEVLPEILRSSRRARIWCAGCSTGEEAYTLAMLAELAIPGGGARGCVRILGTDINPRALEKARRGIYTRWSFRGMSDEMRNRFFDPAGEGSFSVKPLFRENVFFSHINLAEEIPSLWEDGEPADAIFCRNVLIYFDSATIERILDRFFRLLAPKGWLVVAPCETSILLGSRYSPVNFGEATLYRKGEEAVPFFFSGSTSPASSVPDLSSDLLPLESGSFETSPDAPDDDIKETPGGLYVPPAWVYGDDASLTGSSVGSLRALSELWDESSASSDAERDIAGEAVSCRDESSSEELYEEALVAYRSGRWDDAEAISEALAGRSVAAKALLARILANRGMYGRALELCEEALAADKGDPTLHYLLSMIRMERKEEKEAAVALRSALFLDPDFVAAHYALGTLALREKRPEDAKRHFRNASVLLARMPEDAQVPESEGMTARALLETIRRLGH